ncbi:hypothetical protein V493_05039 [Pseudogymnoascus sp. VKM F-4281 (FW-2241)]|nr:hypothetical protein V493_05039 [Pseudogymnoascus sp. VKM F-4281 (FW-2241)]
MTQCCMRPPRKPRRAAPPQMVRTSPTPLRGMVVVVWWWWWWCYLYVSKSSSRRTWETGKEVSRWGHPRRSPWHGALPVEVASGKLTREKIFWGLAREVLEWGNHEEVRGIEHLLSRWLQEKPTEERRRTVDGKSMSRMKGPVISAEIQENRPKAEDEVRADDLEDRQGSRQNTKEEFGDGAHGQPEKKLTGSGLGEGTRGLCRPSKPEERKKGRKEAVPSTSKKGVANNAIFDLGTRINGSGGKETVQHVPFEKKSCGGGDGDGAFAVSCCRLLSK